MDQQMQELRGQTIGQGQGYGNHTQGVALQPSAIGIVAEEMRGEQDADTNSKA